MASGGVGRLHNLAVVLAASAQAWRTEQAPAALDGLKVHDSFDLPASTLEPTASPSTDQPYLTTRDTAGNIPGVEFPIPISPYYRAAGTGASPLEELIFALLCSGSTATQQAATPAYLHTMTEASLHALLRDPPTRFFTVADKLPFDTGQVYRSVPSAVVTGFELESSAKDGVKLAVKLRGNKVSLDSSTISGAWSNVTYADQSKLLKHHHAKDLIWLAKSAAVGGSPVTFGSGQAIHPSKIIISVDRAQEDVFTDAQDSDCPDSQTQPKITLKLEFPKVLAANQTLLDDNFAAYVDDTDALFHFLVKWKYPVAIDTTYYPYWEIGFPALLLTKCDPLKVEPGKFVPHTMEFTALEPTASAHLPTQFPYGGNGASGTRQDAMYVAMMGTNTAALIA